MSRSQFELTALDFIHELLCINSNLATINTESAEADYKKDNSLNKSEGGRSM